MLTYRQTLDFMFDKLPMYQRIGGAAYKADLNNTLQLCALLENPENKFRSVHIAGTNGKGSTSNLIASVLQQAGLKTGLYTSPHYRDFRERIRINGMMIPEQAVVEFFEKWRNEFEKIDLSFFEMTVGMAFDFFRKEKVDIAVIEVGMGGRLDSTNVITPLVSVITNIGLDHTKFLGTTLMEIAGEKAGIIKPGVPVVIGETQPEVADVFNQIANHNNAPITFADQHWKALPTGRNQIKITLNDKPFFEDLNFPLGGSYQRRNVCTALETLRLFSQQSGIELSREIIAKGVENILTNTGLKGRWQTIGSNPLIICDSGHNVDGIRQVVINITETPHRHLHFVFGMVNDKNTEGMLSLLPKNATYYFCKPNIPRGLDPELLAEDASKYGITGGVYSSVQSALEKAKTDAGAGDLIVVGGSTFVVAEVV